jgi:hypothetical protein
MNGPTQIGERFVTGVWLESGVRMERVVRILDQIDDLFCEGTAEEVNTLRSILSAIRGPDGPADRLQYEKQHTVSLRRATFPKLAAQADIGEDRVGFSVDPQTMISPLRLPPTSEHFSDHCIMAAQALVKLGRRVEEVGHGAKFELHLPPGSVVPFNRAEG